jgi:hypothetical protein
MAKRKKLQPSTLRDPAQQQADPQNLQEPQNPQQLDESMGPPSDPQELQPTEDQQLEEPAAPPQEGAEPGEQGQPTEGDLGQPEEDDQIDEEAIRSALEANQGPQMTPLTPEERQASIDRLFKFQRVFQNCKDARRRYDREWLARDLFRRGYQFSSQNQKSGTVTMSTRQNARIPVNLTWAYTRSIKNQVTSFNPKWEVMPEFKGKRAEQDARLSGKLLDYLFIKNNMNKQIKEAVIQGLYFSVGGPFEVYWDENYDNGKNQPRGEVVIRLHDPFDVYWDPNCTSSADATCVFKCIRTAIDDIRTDIRFRKEVRSQLTTGSPKKAESEYKQFLLQTIQNNQVQVKDNEYVILKEGQMIERQDDGSIQIRFITWIDEVTEPLLDVLVDQEDFDMEVYQADMNPLEMYAESWSKHVIALNRVYNALESSVFDYNYKYAKGRLVVDKNSGLRAINNEHGSIIEKNRGAEVKPLPLQPLPSSVESQLGRIKAVMEDISGVHEATLGRTPPGIKSGIGVAELKQSDSTNQDDLVQNLEQCLMRLGRKVLRLVAIHYDTPRIRRVIGSGRVVEHFAVVGSDYVSNDKKTWKVGEEDYPLARVSETNELQVNIGSWLAYSKEAQQKTLIDLATAGIIDKETVLKHLEFPDIQDVLDRTRVEALVEAKRKEDPSMPAGVSQEQLAYAENEMMEEGSPMPVDPETDDHQLHIAIHNLALQGGEHDPMVFDHIQEHRRAMKGGGAGMAADQGGQPGAQPPAGPPPQQQPPQMPPPPQMSQMPPPPPQLPPGMIPMPGGQGVQMPPPPPVPAPPPASYFSAGVQELPMTATSILGGPANSMPTQ